MNRKIIAYKDYFNTFFAELDKGTQDKVIRSDAATHTRPPTDQVYKGDTRRAF